MGLINNLTQGMVADIFRRLRALETASPMNAGAVGSGGFEVYDGGVITISNGGLNVTGTASILGTLIASGTINFTGTVTVSGPMSVSGVMTVTNNVVVASGGKITAGTIQLNPDGSAKFGTMTISPAGKITSGSAEINPDGSVKFGNMTISAAGVITSGNVLLDPSASSGGFTFVSGGGVGGNGGSVLVRGSGNAGLTTNTTASLFAASNSLDVSPTGITVNGPLKNNGMTTTANAANVYFDPVSKQLFYKP